MSAGNNIEAILVLTGLGFWFTVALRVAGRIAAWVVDRILRKRP